MKIFSTTQKAYSPAEIQVAKKDIADLKQKASTIEQAAGSTFMSKLCFVARTANPQQQEAAKKLLPQAKQARTEAAALEKKYGLGFPTGKVLGSLAFAAITAGAGYYAHTTGRLDPAYAKAKALGEQGQTLMADLIEKGRDVRGIGRVINHFSPVAPSLFEKAVSAYTNFMPANEGIFGRVSNVVVPVVGAIGGYKAVKGAFNGIASCFNRQPQQDQLELMVAPANLVPLPDDSDDDL